MSIPLISLVVLGYTRFDSTTRICLESLLPWIEDPLFEILVIDNGSPDESAQKSATWCEMHPRAKFILSERNLGFSGGMNLGASHASGRWLLLVNSDTVFPGYALDALKRVVNEVPEDVAMLGPVTNSAGNGQRLWQPGATHEQWLHIGQWLNENPTRQLMPVYRCDFFCVAVRRNIWNELGGLDPVFGLGYYEDFDFSLRLSKAGYRQFITEDVFVLHAGSASFKANPQAKALMKRNKKLLRSKHPDAQFEHTRLGNFAILRTYQDIRAAGRWVPELERRWQLRIGALKDDAPRSFVKKWLWKKKINQIMST